MNACPEREPESASADAGATAAPRPVASTCQAIIEGCASSPIVPSMLECKQLLAGMTEAGRERTRTCMKTHCFDRGLVGCEAVVNVNVK